MRLRALLPAVVAMASMRSAAAAPADAPIFAWHAPPSCPTELAVHARIEQMLGRSLDDTLDNVDVSIEPSDGAFTAEIKLRGSEPRRLTSPTCATLADAVVLIVVRLAREAALRRESLISFVEPVPSLPSPVDVDVPRLGTRTIQHAPAWRLGARLSGSLSIGVVPGLGRSGEVAAQLARRAVFGELGVARWFGTARAYREDVPSAVDVALTTAIARAGWSQRGHAPAIRVWSTVELGQMTGTGVGLVSMGPGTSSWLAVGGGGAVSWSFTPWLRACASLEVTGPLLRPRFMLDDGRPLYKPSALGARMAIGLEVGR